MFFFLPDSGALVNEGSGEGGATSCEASGDCGTTSISDIRDAGDAKVGLISNASLLSNMPNLALIYPLIEVSLMQLMSDRRSPKLKNILFRP
jgi:hypothetical protein